jgi:Anti-sigma factor NepR
VEIGKQLRAMYQDIINSELPDEICRLLEHHRWSQVMADLVVQSAKHSLAGVFDCPAEARRL